MPDLTEDQRNVLDALMLVDATPAERTAEALCERTGLTYILPLLRKLEEDFDPPLAAHDVDETSGTRLWWATPAAGDLLDAER
jgi:hypothetical protein